MKGIAVVFGLLCGVTLAHMGIISPTPRDTSQLQETSPCGNVNNQFGGTVTELTPGEVHDIVVQSNQHGGIFRVALSQVGSDTYDCILIDHIPQHNGDVDSETIPIVVPDVDCQTCAIQVYMVVPSGTCCDKSAGRCSTTWYSCSNVRIKGKTPRNQLKCAQPCTWSYRDDQPGFYSTGSANNAVWFNTGGNNYKLNVSGAYHTPTCPTTGGVKKTECELETTEISEDDGDTKNSNSLTNGGKMSAGGVIGIIVVILVLVGIAITWFIAAKNKKAEPKPFSPMMAYSSQQAIVQISDEGNATTTQTRPQMPPPPPQRV